MADVEYCRGKAPVIAVKESHRWAPWADVLYSSCQKWWPYYEGVTVFQGVKFGISPLTPQPKWNITVLRNGGTCGLSTDPSSLCNGQNSGYAAVNLAIHLGARRVVLLGYDMKRQRKRSHFFGEHPTKLQCGTPYHRFAQRFDAMVEPLKKLGVEVVNCTRDSALSQFRRVDLREAL